MHERLQKIATSKSVDTKPRVVGNKSPSVFRTMRHGPFPRMLDGGTRRQRSAKPLYRGQRFHSFPPLAELWKFGVHGFAFLGQPKRVGAGQNEEVRKREVRAQQMLFAIQLPLHHLQCNLDLRESNRPHGGFIASSFEIQSSSRRAGTNYK
jgi:hypothetical protein